MGTRGQVIARAQLTPVFFGLFLLVYSRLFLYFYM
jgi:hypothetical protein